MSFNLNTLTPAWYKDTEVMERVRQHLGIADPAEFYKWAKSQGFQENITAFFTTQPYGRRVHLRDLALLCEKLNVSADFLVFGKEGAPLAGKVSKPA